MSSHSQVCHICPYFPCFRHLFQDSVSVFLIAFKHIGHQFTNMLQLFSVYCKVAYAQRCGVPCKSASASCTLSTQGDFYCRFWKQKLRTQLLLVRVSSFFLLCDLLGTSDNTDNIMCGVAWIWNSCPAYVCKKIVCWLLTQNQ